MLRLDSDMNAKYVNDDEAENTIESPIEKHEMLANQYMINMRPYIRTKEKLKTQLTMPFEQEN